MATLEISQPSSHPQMSSLVEKFINILNAFGIKTEVEWDSTDLLINCFDKEGLRFCTFCFDGGIKLMEVWHGHYQAKYDELLGDKNITEDKENKDIADSVRTFVNLFNGSKRK